MLSLYDTRARAKRRFEPARPDRVSVYLCGPTVYDYAHIGNARPAVAFDTLFRLLRRRYGAENVLFARNVTDVDDKINAKAMSEGVPIGEITARYEAAYLDDCARLNVLPPTFTPHVTEHMDDIILQIGRLVEAGAAYAAEGHVLFDVASFADYGELSGRALEDMIAGARVEVAPYKKNPQDFVLWKPSRPGEPVWESPWGTGRPGWHIECSAMIEAVLGLPVDIHCGGIDLVFPHHENENAQGRCAHAGAPYARYWAHNGFLTVDAEKMSKSVGNVLRLHDLVRSWPGEAVRWALLSAHYRAPLDWTDALLDQSRRSLDRLYGALRRAEVHSPDAASSEAEPAAAVVEALEDDLNTPQAMAVLFDLSSQLEKAVAAGDRALAARLKGALRAGAALMGVLQDDPVAWFQSGVDDALRVKVEGLIAARAQARASRDFARADAIRAELSAIGVEVMDGADGAAWRLKEGS